MNRSSIVILKLVLGLIGLITLTVCLITLSMLVRGQAAEHGFILLGVYGSMVPFFFALQQAFKLLSYIDKNQAFSTSSVKAIKNIKYAALVFGAVYTIGMPYIYMVGDRTDAPGTIVLGLLFAGGAYVIAIFAAVAQRLFQNAVNLKSENDLTI